MPTTDILFSYAVLGGGALTIYLILNLVKDRIEKSAKKIKKKKKENNSDFNIITHKVSKLVIVKV